MASTTCQKKRNFNINMISRNFFELWQSRFSNSLPCEQGEKKRLNIKDGEKKAQRYKEYTENYSISVRLTLKICVPVTYHNIGLPSHQCRNCHATMWYEEREEKSKTAANPTFLLCGQRGKVLLPIFKERSEIDDIIYVELPSPTDDPAGYKVVTEYMLHGPCGKDARYTACKNDGKCSKHFPKSFLAETFLDEEGYPHYRRRDNKADSTSHSKGKKTRDSPGLHKHIKTVELLQAVGDGTLPTKMKEGEDEPTWIDIPKKFLIKCWDSPIQQIATETYPDFTSRQTDDEYLKEGAILTPRNDDAEAINEFMFKQLSGEPVTYYSADEICKASTNNIYQHQLYPIEFLNSLNFPGMPPHA
ncbi:ATP-dependent DNA helicase PIF1-like protein [Tanacetum coccineum]